MNRGQRLVKRFRDFFSEMERGRILLLGIIACVMLGGRIYSTLGSIIYVRDMANEIDSIPSEHGISMALDFLPELLAYSIALGLVVCSIVIVRRRMRAEGETMTPEHLRELFFIALALVLFSVPSTTFGVMVSIEDITDPDPWGFEFERTNRLRGTIGLVAALLVYATIAFLSWRAYRRESTDLTHRLERGRVLALTLIVVVMVSSGVIYSYGWLRYHQIITWEEEATWYTYYTSPLWFYFYTVLLCCFLGWLYYRIFHMRSDKLSMSPGQLQELAVISIGLWLFLLPFFIDVSVDYVQRYVLEDPYDPGSTRWEAYETKMFYYRLSILFEFIAYLLIGLLAFRRYRQTIPIEVTAVEGPAESRGDYESFRALPPED